MTKYIAWVDNKNCLDPKCLAVGNSTWDTRAIYCSDKCFTADGHKDTPMGEDDTHELLGVGGIDIEPDCCQHCASCDTKVVQGIECDFECDTECIAISKAKGVNEELLPF